MYLIIKGFRNRSSRKSLWKCWIPTLGCLVGTTHTNTKVIKLWSKKTIAGHLSQWYTEIINTNGNTKHFGNAHDDSLYEVP